MSRSLSNQREQGENDLDGQILDELREGPQTQADLVTELRAPHERVHSRLQFLDAAGYIESSDGETNRYELHEDPREIGVFEEHPFLRPVAFGGVLVLSGILSYLVLRSYLKPPFVVVVAALAIALITARIVIAPRQPENSYIPIQQSHEADELPDTNDFDR